MKSKLPVLLLSLIALCLSIAAPVRAQQTSNPTTFTVTLPGPSITTISPLSIGAGAGAFTLTVNGTQFVTGDVVQFCEVTPTPCTTPTPVPTTFVSATQLTAAVPSSIDTASATYNVTVFRAVSHSVNINATPSVTAGVTGYKIYRSQTSGGPYAVLTPTPVSGFPVVDATVQNGQTYYYVATAVSANGESAYSNQQAAVVPAS